MILRGLARAIAFPVGVGLLAASPLLLSGLWHGPRWFYALTTAMLGLDAILGAFGVLRIPALERLTGVSNR